LCLGELDSGWEGSDGFACVEGIGWKVSIWFVCFSRVERRDERAGARGAVTSTIPSGRGAGGWGMASSSGDSNASCSNCDIVITCHETLEALIGFEGDAD
jgi:hypothetical protein